MKKLAISIAVAAAFGLAGCGDSLDDIKQDVAEQGPVKPISRVIFDPTAGRVSVPNDLLFQGTTDGTLTLDSGANPDYTNPQVALGALDGWSTQNPFAIDLSFAAGVSLNTDTAQTPGAVRLFKAVMGDPTSPEAACTVVPRGAACQIVEELVFGQDFVTAGRGNSVAVIPLKPLERATTYLLALTNVLQDSNGESIKPSTTYELVKQDIATLPLGSDAQRALQGVINSFENVLVRDEGLNKDNIIYTAAITTQSTDVVFNTVKQIIAASAQQRPLVVTAQGYNAGQALVAAELIDPDDAVLTNAAYAAATTAQVYKGSVSLPYFSPVSTDEEPLAALTGRWLAQYDSPVTLLGAIQAGLLDPATLGLTAEELQNPANLFGLDLGIDTSRHITKFNPFPKTTTLDTVPVLMTVPDLAQINMLRAAQQQPEMTMPVGGWPVVIFQHGITSEKENMLAIAGSMAMAGYAVVAIDHMLHGERGFEVEVMVEDVITPLVINASTNSATDYMNLQSLLTTRDNVRQSISDIMALRAALNVSNLAQGGTINPTKVSFIGHSLGGIAGTSAIAMANTPVQSSTLTVEQKAAIDSLFGIDTATLAMPGGAIANFLLDSASFGPIIKASVLFGVGGEEIGTAFTQFATAQNGCGAPLEAPFAACYNAFEEYLLQVGQEETVTALYAGYTQFAFAAQTVIDSSDPNNYAEQLVNSETPVYMIEVLGDGVNNLPDQVIPNGYFNPLVALAAGKMPLAGTEPLARLLGTFALPATAGIVNLNGENAIARYSEGDHGSILSPAASGAATLEMQRQTASFIASGGAVIQVSNPAVLAPAN